MQIFLTAIKAMIWGALLLVFTLVVAVKIFTIDEKFKALLPVGTSKKVEQAYKIVAPKLDTLINLYYQPNAQGKIPPLREEIKLDLQKLCSDCQLKSFFPTSGYEAISYDSYLKSRSSADTDTLNNTVYTISIVFTILFIALSFLLIYALWMYRGASTSLATFIGLFIPFYCIFFSISLSMMDDKYLYFRLGTNDFPTNLIIFSAIYFFIAYPAIYALTKKSGVSIKKALLFKAI
jgi:hypothetical protein